MQRRHVLNSIAAAAATALALPLRAQAWPARAIKLVVPFPPGTSPDIMARIVSEPLGRALGQPIVIDNRPGAGGNIGTGAVAHAEPDGYTLLFTIQGPLVTAPLLTSRLGYDPARELAPVTLVATSPNLLVTAPALGAKSVADFVRIAKARPGELNYGSVGNGSASHLAMELFMRRAGISLVHVPVLPSTATKAGPLIQCRVLTPWPFQTNKSKPQHRNWTYRVWPTSKSQVLLPN